jgi:hypothetical protein
MKVLRRFGLLRFLILVASALRGISFADPGGGGEGIDFLGNLVAIPQSISNLSTFVYVVAGALCIFFILWGIVKALGGNGGMRMIITAGCVAFVLLALPAFTNVFGFEYGFEGGAGGGN